MRLFRVSSYILFAFGILLIVLVAIQPHYRANPRWVSNDLGDMTERSSTPPPKFVQTQGGQKLWSSYHLPHRLNNDTTGFLCKIEELDPIYARPPSHLQEVSTSVNIRSKIWHDNSTFAWQNNTFDDIHALVAGKNTEVYAQTKSKAFHIKTITSYGAELSLDENSASCWPTYNARLSSNFGPVATFNHQDQRESYDTLYVRGRVSQGCLSLLDKRGEVHLAVFPNQQDAGTIYTTIFQANSNFLPEANVVWLGPLPIPTAGLKTTLSEPVAECGGISKAILLRDGLFLEDYYYSLPPP